MSLIERGRERYGIEGKGWVPRDQRPSVSWCALSSGDYLIPPLTRGDVTPESSEENDVFLTF